VKPKFQTEQDPSDGTEANESRISISLETLSASSEKSYEGTAGADHGSDLSEQGGTVVGMIKEGVATSRTDGTSTRSNPWPYWDKKAQSELRDLTPSIPTKDVSTALPDAAYTGDKTDDETGLTAEGEKNRQRKREEDELAARAAAVGPMG
jgi:hypothetical protein